MRVLDELESATARLEADPFDGEALEARAAAIARLRSGLAGHVDLERMKAVLDGGDRIRQKVLVVREQLRASLAQSHSHAKLAEAYRQD